MPPLILERLHFFSAKNPYFEHARWQCWLAYRGAVPVGRISAQIDELYLSHCDSRTGFFGSLEAEDSAEVFRSLFETAEAWLQAEGMTTVQGPFNLSINQECGLLIKGYDDPPMVMMGHARPYYSQQVEAHGYKKAQDMLAYRIGIHFPLPSGVARFLNKAKGSVRIRPLRRKQLQEELAIIRVSDDDHGAIVCHIAILRAKRCYRCPRSQGNELDRSSAAGYPVLAADGSGAEL